VFATANPTKNFDYVRLRVAFWIAAPAPSSIAWAAMVTMADPITIPASQLPFGGGTGNAPLFFSRCMFDILWPLNIHRDRNDMSVR
jgi:hypothetical protein